MDLPEAPLSLFDLTPCHFFKACGNHVTDADTRGPVCAGCRRIFGAHLQPVTPPATETAPAPLTAAQRFEIQVAARQHRAPDRAPDPLVVVRRNQRCWLCEDRRTCTLTPQGWECANCHE